MKSLKDTISESLITEKRFTPEVKSEREAILNFINENYRVSPRGLKLRKENDVWIVDYYRSTLEVTNKSITSLTNGLFQWGNVDGTFDCSYCENLMDLEGTPQDFGSLDCRYCKNLKSFKGCGKFYDLTCIGCDSLLSFEGLDVNNKKFRNIFAMECKNLKSLKGLPTKCFDVYLDNCTSLESLKGGRKEVCLLSIAGCSNIKSWDGAPNIVWQGLFYGGCKNLKGQEPPCDFKGDAKAYYGYNGTTGASMIGR